MEVLRPTRASSSYTVGQSTASQSGTPPAPPLAPLLTPSPSLARTNFRGLETVAAGAKMDAVVRQLIPARDLVPAPSAKQMDAISRAVTSASLSALFAPAAAGASVISTRASGSSPSIVNRLISAATVTPPPASVGSGASMPAPTPLPTKARIIDLPPLDTQSFGPDVPPPVLIPTGRTPSGIPAGGLGFGGAADLPYTTAPSGGGGNRPIWEPTGYAPLASPSLPASAGGGFEVSPLMLLAGAVILVLLLKGGG